MAGPEFNASTFNGRLRLFPLPNLVLFPNVVQALRIFEPRYVALMEEALADDRRFAMALLRPGWEPHYAGQPDIHATVCLGRINTYHRNEDGSYNLMLMGEARVRILEELEEGLPFRTARGAALRDAYRDPLQQGSAHLRETLIEVFKQVAPKKLGVTPAIRKMLREEVTLGALTDIIAYIAPLDPADKQRLLDDTLVERRASQLIGLLRSQEGPANSDSPQPFPPPFSAN